MTNNKDPDQTASPGVFIVFVSPICPYTKIFTLKIMHNILREKYFDIVSEGQEIISSVFEIVK